MRTPMVLALLGLTAASSFAGMCPPHEPVTSVLTPNDTEIPADGGVIVGTEPQGRNNDAGIAGPLKFHDINADLDPVIHTLAPGLDLYQAPATLGPELQLGGARFKRQGGKAPGLLAAPHVSRVDYRNDDLPNITHVAVTAKLAAAAPADAIALVVFGVSKTGNTPRSWGRVIGGSTTEVVYESPRKCSTEAPGTIISVTGDRVALAWLDRTGRLSNLSPTITVAQAKP